MIIAWSVWFLRHVGTDRVRSRHQATKKCQWRQIRMRLANQEENKYLISLCFKRSFSLAALKQTLFFNADELPVFTRQTHRYDQGQYHTHMQYGYRKHINDHTTTESICMNSKTKEMLAWHNMLTHVWLLEAVNLNQKKDHCAPQ